MLFNFLSSAAFSLVRKSFGFMNAETYDQIQVAKDIVGSGAPYLQENMTV